MRKLLLALLGAAALGGCGYFPVPPDPIRYVTSPAEVSTCRRIAPVGVARTDGTGMNIGNLTVAVPGYLAPQPDVVEYGPAVSTAEVPGENFAVRLNVMRDRALALGASDLLLVRRFYRDYSYVEGVAYGCRR